VLILAFEQAKNGHIHELECYRLTSFSTDVRLSLVHFVNVIMTYNIRTSKLKTLGRKLTEVTELNEGTL
jgi:hypothetical protein